LRQAKSIDVSARAVTPVTAFGLALQVASGVVLLAADAMPVAVNPAFRFRMAMFALGLVNIAAFRCRARGQLGFPARPGLRRCRWRVGSACSLPDGSLPRCERRFLRRNIVTEAKRKSLLPDNKSLLPDK
jgi:hypothetical protein